MHRHTHLGIYAVAIADDHLLLVRKGRGPYTGCWDLPGGGIEFGEEPTDALRREVMEETGLHVAPSATLAILSHRVEYTPDDGAVEELHHIGIIVEVATEKEEPRAGADGEDALGAAWIAVEELGGLPLTPFAARVARGELVMAAGLSTGGGMTSRSGES